MSQFPEPGASAPPPSARRNTPRFTAPRIDMSHGAGGKATHKLIEGLLLPALDNPMLAPLTEEIGRAHV